MRNSLEDIKNMVKKVEYKGLPEELEPYHYYISDTGHCIMCVLEMHLVEAKGYMDDYEIPVPVKYVLEKGYRIVEGYIIIDAGYHITLGLDVDEKYTEY